MIMCTLYFTMITVFFLVLVLLCFLVLDSLCYEQSLFWWQYQKMTHAYGYMEGVALNGAS